MTIDEELDKSHPNCSIITSYDGVVEQRNIEKALYRGKYSECVKFVSSMSNTVYNHYHKGKYELDLLDLETNRLVSFVA
jgi:hypothetical protein